MISSLLSVSSKGMLALGLTTVFFWAVTGAAAARRVGRPRLRSALLGGVLPVVGSVIVLAMGAQRPRRAAAAPATGPTPAAQPISAFPAPATVVQEGSWGSPPPRPTASPAITHGWGSPQPSPAPDSTSTATWGAPAPSLPPAPVLPAAPAPVTPPLVSQPTDETPRRRSTLQLAVASAGCLALLVSLVIPWVSLRTPGIDVGPYSGGDSWVTAAPTVLAAATLAAAAALHARRPRGTWAVLGAAVASCTCLLAMELLLVANAAEKVLRHFRDVPSSVKAGWGDGAVLLLLSGLIAATWSVLAIATCPEREGGPRGRRRS